MGGREEKGRKKEMKKMEGGKEGEKLNWSTYSNTEYKTFKKKRHWIQNIQKQKKRATQSLDEQEEKQERQVGKSLEKQNKADQVELGWEDVGWILAKPLSSATLFGLSSTFSDITVIKLLSYGSICARLKNSF